MFMATIIGLAVIDPTFRAELAKDCEGTLERYHFGPLSMWERDQAALFAAELGRSELVESLEIVHRLICPVWPVCCAAFRVSPRPPEGKARA